MVKAIVGANWGDEGKGKITDVLAANSDMVIRFQGGSNAGHTIINNYGRFALHQLPSGVFYDNITNIIGNGVALNVDNFINELKSLEEQGVKNVHILVSDRAQIVLPYHILFDCYEEERLSKESFGSTKSGIAPFYSDKFAKIGFQVNELYDDTDSLRKKLERILEVKNLTIKNLYHKEELSVDEIFNKLMEYKEMLEPYVASTFDIVNDAVKAGKNILLEGQLGTLKDTDFGIYPMVTSSNTIAGYGAVGAGEFVSEIHDEEEAEELRKRGGDKGEYGATTGRPRRVGWLDLVATRYGCKVQGATQVAFTVIDALGYLDEIPVVVAYELDGERIDYFPSTTKLKRCKPIIEVLPGWKCDIRGIKEYDKLPENCRKYIEFAEKAVGVPFKMISNGPKREDIILR